MTLQEQLVLVSEVGFSRIPKRIAQVLRNVIKEITSSDLQEKSLKVGEKITDTELIDVSGKPRQLSEFLDQKYLILNFYRGSWCPYCNMELRAYESLKDDFQLLETSIIGISIERPTITSQTSEKNTLSFPMLCDENAQFMKSLGIVFTLNDDLKREYANFGIDLKQIHNNLNYELPVPGVYIINRNLEIIFRNLNENYMTRLEPKDILTFLEEKSEIMKIQESII
ncbi:peroxiredoxin-like family protein [Aquimarina algiphila]|uniref:peroxiredoxin-like family protein n=1 Tax=Aquimarina algiphila TaxID=2047982 RepID=UPI00232D9285|nr:peroxiredoxin-like family protein [Aquimarina algiphila]